MRSRLLAVLFCVLALGSVAAEAQECTITSGGVYYEDENGEMYISTQDDGSITIVIYNEGGSTVIENWEGDFTGDVWVTPFDDLPEQEMDSSTRQALAYETVKIWTDKADSVGCQ